MRGWSGAASGVMLRRRPSSQPYHKMRRARWVRSGSYAALRRLRKCHRARKCGEAGAHRTGRQAWAGLKALSFVQLPPAKPPAALRADGWLP